MPIYLAIAYRWGWTNSHSYFVLCSSDLDLVRAAAETACDDRNGKYGVAVLEMPQSPSAGREKVLFYFPSVYEEPAPGENARIEAFKSLGQRVYGAVTHLKTTAPSLADDGALEFVPVDVPAWLRAEATRAAAQHGLVYAPSLPPSSRKPKT